MRIEKKNLHVVCVSLNDWIGWCTLYACVVCISKRLWFPASFEWRTPTITNSFLLLTLIGFIHSAVINDIFLSLLQVRWVGLLSPNLSTERCKWVLILYPAFIHLLFFFISINVSVTLLTCAPYRKPADDTTGWMRL